MPHSVETDREVPPLHLELFGEVKLWRDRSHEVALPRKTQLLLAYLASNAGGDLTRDKLAGLLWAERADSRARQNLRQCLFTLSKAIGEDGPPLIHADRHHVALNQESVEVDVWHFERLLAHGTPNAMQQATRLFTGDFLAGLSIGDEIVDAWCAAERVRLRDRCYEALATLASHFADTANLDDAIEVGRRLTSLDPLREDGHRTLMRLYSRAGRRAEALKQYRLCVETLRRELNVEPEDATARLFADLRGHPEASEEPATPAPASPEEAATRDERATLAGGFLGVHGSKALAVGLGVVVGLVAVILWFTVR